jgi:competence protein CoiA
MPYWHPRRKTGIHPFIEDGGAAKFAMGMSVYVRLTSYGVIYPAASQVAAIRDRLAALVVFVASKGSSSASRRTQVRDSELRT